MKELDALSLAISDAYISLLNSRNGNNKFTHRGVSWEIERLTLADGIQMNVYAAAKDSGVEDVIALAHKKLQMLFNLEGRNYTLTSLGIQVIEMLNTKAINRYLSNKSSREIH